MLPGELTGDAPEWRLGGKNLEKPSRAPALGQGTAGSSSLLWTLLGPGSRSLEDLASLLKCNNYFDFTLYVASSLLSFVYLDSFT